MKTKTCIFAILIAGGLTTSWAQDTWTQKANFGGMARYGAVGFSIGSKGYMGTGYDGSYEKDFWEYDPAINAWTQKANVGDTGREIAVGFSIGGKGYIGTGNNSLSGGLRNDFWEYDPSTNAWTRKADFAGSGRWTAVGFSIGSKGYIGTGFSQTGNQKDFWEYDPSTDAWTQKADFEGVARHHAAGFSIGTKGYIGTGDTHIDNTGDTKDFWEYDPVTDMWTEKANFGGTARGSAVGFSIGSNGYIGTGIKNFITLYKDFWEYDSSANAWTQKANFGGVARQVATGFSIGGKGYIGTGLSQNAFRKDFWEYTPEKTSIAIDIKPGTFPNSINPRGKGVIPVAILTTDTFDATAVDPTTVRFGPNGTEAAPMQSALENVDGDGDTDMILHFKTQNTDIVCGDTSASLTGETFGGEAIEGSDSIETVGCK